jgi:hypothetical protein
VVRAGRRRRPSDRAAVPIVHTVQHPVPVFLSSDVVDSHARSRSETSKHTSVQNTSCSLLERYGSRMVRECFGNASGMVRKWFANGSGDVRVWSGFGCRSGVIRVWLGREHLSLVRFPDTSAYSHGNSICCLYTCWMGICMIWRTCTCGSIIASEPRSQCAGFTAFAPQLSSTRPNRHSWRLSC